MTILTRATFVAPALGWILLLAGHALALPPLFTGLVLVGVVLAAVHHAETVAHRVGEPFGTLILAVAVTVIELGLILSLMLANREAATTLARDTVFAASMIILNLLLGLCLVAGARHQKEARFTRTGATAALSTLATLMVLTLILPNATTSVPGPVFSASQLAFVAAFSLLLYLTFVFVQTVGNRDYFLPQGDLERVPDAHAPQPSDRATWTSFAALLACLGAVVLLAKSLSKPLEVAIAQAGAPHALVGVAIAALVLLPESIAAVRAANANRLQTSLNLALGSALATIGLTIPAVAVASIYLDLPLALGLDAKGTILLALTLFVAALSLARGRTTVLHGAVHLTIFAAYLVMTVLP
ncbi:ionic transporter y4hA [Chakrabartia godavariana]|nr:ionic transporter y4hA [Chakrabartia godavariana]